MVAAEGETMFASNNRNSKDITKNPTAQHLQHVIFGDAKVALCCVAGVGVCGFHVRVDVQ